MSGYEGFHTFWKLTLSPLSVCAGNRVSSQKVGKPSYPDTAVGLRKFYWTLLHVLNLLKWFSHNGAIHILHIVLKWQRYISNYFTMPSVKYYWVHQKYCNLVMWGSVILWAGRHKFTIPSNIYGLHFNFSLSVLIT